jgi:uncharacterized delta-60 repeat protein
VARWLPDGTPDPAFSGDGRFTLQVGGAPSTADAVALQPDDKIVVAGVAGTDLALLRLLPDGTPDPAFGTGGQVTTPFAGADSAAQAVTVLSDGTIVAVGLVSTPLSGAFAIARYAADGMLLWQTTTAFAEGPRAVASDVVVQPDASSRSGSYSRRPARASRWPATSSRGLRTRRSATAARRTRHFPAAGLTGSARS